MATKKQKRAAAHAKHLQYMKDYSQSGLEAQRKDRAERHEKNCQAWQTNHDKNHSWKKRIKECPICQGEMKAARESSFRAVHVDEEVDVDSFLDEVANS